jgi:hypothetical protein
VPTSQARRATRPHPILFELEEAAAIPRVAGRRRYKRSAVAAMFSTV